MPFTVYAAAAAIAVSIPVLWWSLGADRATRKLVHSNLSSGRTAVTDARELSLTRSSRDRVMGPAMAAVAAAARRFTPGGLIAGLERRMNLAGKRWPVERLLNVKVLLASGILLFCLARAATEQSIGWALVGLIGALAGYFAPDVWLVGRAQERQQAIERELADTLDQITISVEAGLGFDGATARAAKSGEGPFAQELARVLQDIEIGVPRTTALDAMLDRTDVADLRQFIHSVEQADRHGVPIAQVLRVQSAELREKRRQRAEERALKVPVKLVFPLVFCILPTLFIVLIGPAVIRISGSSFAG